MSNLLSIEKLKLESFLEMGGGYVLDFSNRTLEEFILKHTGTSIYDDRYDYATGSKANRLRAFWNQESNYVVGKLTLAFLEHWRAKKLIEGTEINPTEQGLLDECLQIGERLVQDGADSEDVSEIAVDVHFAEIQRKIVEQIELAKFTIWVAVAWFTDRELFNYLVTKKEQGVNVQLVIIDDDINRNSGLNYEDQFETHRVRRSGNYQNIMHNKFCIIDLKSVIHGSYNWTNRARYNNETITVTHNREVAEQFAEQFVQLKPLCADRPSGGLRKARS